MPDVTFLAENTTRLGAWQADYPDGGYVPAEVETPGITPPSYATVTPSGSAGTVQFDQHSSDPRALVRPGGPDGFIVELLSGFRITYEVTLTEACRMGLYCYDPDGDRVTDVMVLASDESTVLDDRTLEDFNDPTKWLDYLMEPGHYYLMLTAANHNVLTAGLFFGPVDGPPPLDGWLAGFGSAGLAL